MDNILDPRRNQAVESRKLYEEMLLKEMPGIRNSNVIKNYQQQIYKAFQLDMLNYHHKITMIGQNIESSKTLQSNYHSSIVINYFSNIKKIFTIKFPTLRISNIR